MARTDPQYTVRPPTLAAFLVGDAIGFVPKPWPRAKFKEALVDTLYVFGDPWVICECKETPLFHQHQENADKDSWLSVTKMAMETRSEFTEMLKIKPYEACKELENNISGKWKIAKTEDDHNTFCLIGINEEKKPEFLSQKRVLPDMFMELLDKVKNKECETLQKTMLHLEEELSQTRTTSLKLNDKEFKMKIPTIVVMVEGDLDTISHVAEAVEKNIPVLLVRGSGMAADLIGYCLDENEGDDDVLETRAPLLFGTLFSKEDFETLKKNVQTIRENRSKLTEFDILTESVTSLKDKVTECIIRIWAMEHVMKGEKALTKTDVKSTEYQPDTSHIDLPNATGVPQQAMYSDTSQKRKLQRKVSTIVPISNEAVRPKTSRPSQRQTPCSSTDVETEHTNDGYSNAKPSPLAIYMLYQIHEFQTNDTRDDMLGQILLRFSLQENLYNITERLVDKGVTLQWKSEKNENEGKTDGMSLYEEIWRERKNKNDDKTRTCTADIIEFPENDLPKRKEDVWVIGCNIIRYKIDEKFFPSTIGEKDNKNGGNAEKEKKRQEKEKRKEKERNTMTPSDLLLWALLTNKKEMAELFWKRSNEPILTALIASAILRKMSRKAHALEEEAMEKELLLHSRAFRQRAIDVTQRFYEINEQEAIFVLERENKDSVWGICESALEFSLTHKIHKFVAHHVPQRSFNRIWFGGDFFRYKDLDQKKTQQTLCCKWRTDYSKSWLMAPVTKFAIHYLFFSLFLVCLSAFVMTNIKAKKWPIDEKSVYEYCAYLWLFADILEEYGPPAVYTIGQRINSNWSRRAWNHMHNFWNGMDFLSYFTIIMGICFRFGYETTDFGISRRFYTIGLFLMYMRFLHVLLIWRATGPTIIMLKEGLKELLRFVFIMAVFILSAGVFYHANIYPNHYDMFSTFGMQYWSVWKIIYYPYWSIYGEFKKEIEGEDSTGNCSVVEAVYMNDPNIVRCPEADWMVSVMAGFFVLILNLLLVNLIIAMFSFRFEEIKNNSDEFWRFHRSQVIMEFQSRIPVPLNLVLRPYLISKHWQTKKKQKKEKKKDMKARAKLNNKQRILARRWMLSESDAQEL